MADFIRLTTVQQNMKDKDAICRRAGVKAEEFYIDFSLLRMCI